MRIWTATGGARRTWRSTIGRTPAARGCFSPPRGRRQISPLELPKVPPPQSPVSVDAARLPDCLSDHQVPLSQHTFIPQGAGRRHTSLCSARLRTASPPLVSQLLAAHRVRLIMYVYVQCTSISRSCGFCQCFGTSVPQVPLGWWDIQPR